MSSLRAITAEGQSDTRRGGSDVQESGILGAGVAGLHLGLLLRKHGVTATIITDRPAEAVAKMPLMNTVAHHHVTLGVKRSWEFDAGSIATATTFAITTTSAFHSRSPFRVISRAPVAPLITASTFRR